MTRQLYSPRTSRIINDSLPILQSYGYIEQDILDVIAACHHDEALVLEQIGELALDAANGRQWVNISADKASIKKKAVHKKPNEHTSKNENSERTSARARPGQGTNRPEGKSNRIQKERLNHLSGDGTNPKRSYQKATTKEQVNAETSTENHPPAQAVTDTAGNTTSQKAVAPIKDSSVKSSQNNNAKPLTTRGAFVNIVKKTLEKEKVPTPSTISSPQALNQEENGNEAQAPADIKGGDPKPSNKISQISEKETESKTPVAAVNNIARKDLIEPSHRIPKVAEEKNKGAKQPPARAPVTIMARPQDRTAMGTEGLGETSSLKRAEYQPQITAQAVHMTQSSSRNMVQNANISQIPSATPVAPAWRFGSLNTEYYASRYPTFEERQVQDRLSASQPTKYEDVSASKIPVTGSHNPHYRSANRDNHDNMMAQSSYIPAQYHPAAHDQYDQLLQPPSYSHMYPDGRAAYGYYGSGGYMTTGSSGLPYVGHQNPVYVQDSMQQYRGHLDPVAPTSYGYPVKNIDDDVTLAPIKPSMADHHAPPHHHNHVQWTDQNYEQYGMIDGLDTVHPYAFDHQVNPASAYRNVYQSYRPQYTSQ